MLKALLILTLLAGLATIGDSNSDIFTTSTIYARDISRTYEKGDWKYYIEHLIPPGDKYHYEGHLYYKGRDVGDANGYNDYMETSWGKIYWVGRTRVTQYGAQGWMRTPNIRYSIGHELAPCNGLY